jgi:hypothetical protein
VLTSIRDSARMLGANVRRVFLADGDALVLPTHRLMRILKAIAEHMPSVERVAFALLQKKGRI